MVEEENLDIHIEIAVDGKVLKLAPFVRTVVSSTVLGMVSVLKGTAEAKTIEIRLQRKPYPEPNPE